VLLTSGTAAIADTGGSASASAEVHIRGTNGWSVTSGTLDDTPLPAGIAVLGYGLTASSSSKGVTHSHSSGITFQFSRSTASSNVSFEFQDHISGLSLSPTGYAESIVKQVFGGATIQSRDFIDGYDDEGYNKIIPSAFVWNQFNGTFTAPSTTTSLSIYTVFVKARK
jgi:hypothetical protein